MPWYFVPMVLKWAKVKMYVRNGYDGDIIIIIIIIIIIKLPSDSRKALYFTAALYLFIIIFYHPLISQTVKLPSSKVAAY